MVTGMPPLVKKRVEKPPPRKYSRLAGGKSVFANMASTSLCSNSQNGLITACPSRLAWPVPSSVHEPELIK